MPTSADRIALLTAKLAAAERRIAALEQLLATANAQIGEMIDATLAANDASDDLVGSLADQLGALQQEVSRLIRMKADLQAALLRRAPMAPGLQ